MTIERITDVIEVVKDPYNYFTVLLGGVFGVPANIKLGYVTIIVFPLVLVVEPADFWVLRAVAIQRF